MILIGIDTGVKTGFAHSVDGEFQRLSTESMMSAQALVLQIRDDALQSGRRLVACVEDVRKRTWVDPKAGRERLRGIGSVERDCSVWQEFCEHHGISYLLVHPKEVETKTSQTYFTQVTGYIYEVSEHARDAGMMIYKYHRMLKRGTKLMPPSIKPTVYKAHKPRMPRKKKPKA